MPASLKTIRVIGAVLIALAVVPCGSARAQRDEDAPASARLQLTAVSFDDLPGWTREQHAELLSVLIANCSGIRSFRDRPLGGAGYVAERAGSAVHWTEACAAAQVLASTLLRPTRGDARRGHRAQAARQAAARGFFERHFAAYAAGTGTMTGYYEPVMRGASSPDAEFRTPLFAPPPELGAGSPRLRGATSTRIPDRAAIEGGAFAGRNLEIIWLDDPLDAFFLHIQGSGRVVLPDGSLVRIGYAGQNGHPFVGLGRVLVEAGMPRDRMSMQGMRAWLREAGPDRSAELMRRNPSFVFFRRVEGLAPSQGPIGAMGVPLTPRRSVAVDRAHIPLGLPLFVAARDPIDRRPFGRLVLAQDTGGMIRGPTRTDFFWGWGDEAGERAGRMYEEAQVFLLLPRPAPQERIEMAQARR
ncbi:MAG TPA: MltA domain-containing protein [Acetobacteraceae bacterium]|nr:MltA domain-containing protein [Acetobacteraceae bacterium]